MQLQFAQKTGLLYPSYIKELPWCILKFVSDWWGLVAGLLPWPVWAVPSELCPAATVISIRTE